MKKIAILLFLIFNVLFVFANSTNPPALPDNVYGEIFINSVPAPINTIINVEINNNIVGTHSTIEEGKYGNNIETSNRFLISGYFLDVGEVLTFYILKDGTKILATTTPQNPTFESGETKEIRLNFNYEEEIIIDPPLIDPPVIDPPIETPTIISQPSGGSSGGGGSSNSIAPIVTTPILINSDLNETIENNTNLDQNNSEINIIKKDINLPDDKAYTGFLFKKNKNPNPEKTTTTQNNNLNYLVLGFGIIIIIVMIYIFKIKKK